MWIFTKSGFYSVVKHRVQPNNFLVRGRVKADLEELANSDKLRRKPEIIEMTDSDYAFRMVMPKADFIALMVDQMLELEYTSVKDNIDKGEADRHTALYKVWAAMMSLQEGGTYASFGKAYDSSAEMEGMVQGLGLDEVPLDEVPEGWPYEAYYEEDAAQIQSAADELLLHEPEMDVDRAQYLATQIVARFIRDEISS